MGGPMLELLQGKVGVNFPLHHCGHNQICHCQSKLFNKEEIIQILIRSAVSKHCWPQNIPYAWKHGFHKLRENSQCHPKWLFSTGTFRDPLINLSGEKAEELYQHPLSWVFNPWVRSLQVPGSGQGDQSCCMENAWLAFFLICTSLDLFIALAGEHLGLPLQQEPPHMQTQHLALEGGRAGSQRIIPGK